MTVNQIIKVLKKVKAEHGDLKVWVSRYHPIRISETIENISVSEHIGGVEKHVSINVEDVLAKCGKPL